MYISAGPSQEKSDPISHFTKLASPRVGSGHLTRFFGSGRVTTNPAWPVVNPSPLGQINRVI